ncbi:hypothetical protein MRX96_057175 [Rhipicephalus microplus]
MVLLPFETYPKRELVTRNKRLCRWHAQYGSTATSRQGGDVFNEWTTRRQLDALTSQSVRRKTEQMRKGNIVLNQAARLSAVIIFCVSGCSVFYAQCEGSQLRIEVFPR